MQVPSDEHYIETKKVLKGEKSISKEKRTLMEWIQNEYGIRVLNIEFDKIDQGKRDRINIIVADREDQEKMHHSGPDYYGYKKEFQKQILEKYYSIYGDVKKPSISFSRKGQIEPWVCYHVFNNVAKHEANGKIGQEELLSIKKQFDDLGIWEIIQFFEGIFVFYYNDEQLTRNQNSDRVKQLKSRFFHAMKKNDEFNLLNEQKFSIGQDSKQNLDENYEGNLYYFFK